MITCFSRFRKHLQILDRDNDLFWIGPVAEYPPRHPSFHKDNNHHGKCDAKFAFLNLYIEG